MLKSVYLFSFILSFVYLFVLLTFFRKRISPYYIMLFSSILVSNLGYVQMSDADSLNMALFANQTIYLGSSFSAFFLFMCLADLCKNKIKLWVQVLMILGGTLIFYLSSAHSITSQYYKTVELITVNGATVLKKEYGLLHNIYLIYLIINILAGFHVIGKSFFDRKNVSYRNSLMLLATMTMIIIAYAIEKKSGSGFPVLSIAYDIGQTIVLILLLRIKDFDVGYISSELIIETSIGGIICFDSKRRFLGADEDAYRWFPESQELKIDSKFNPEGSDFFEYIESCIAGDNESETELFNQNDIYISVEHSVKREKARNVIHCFFLRDVTVDLLRQNEMKDLNDNLEKKVNEKTKKIRRILNDIIRSMAITVEDRDSNTGGHIQRTGDVVEIFTEHLMQDEKYLEKFSEERFRDTVKAAYLHDFGKIAIPDRILNKPGKFNDKEYEEMKKHSEKGAKIVNRILTHSEDRVFKEIAVNVAHYHHEKWNGQGYPEKISGENIPFEARIMALADVFDALVSERVYKDAMSFDKAFGIIQKDAGVHFDPDLAEEFIKCRPQLENLYNTYKNKKQA